MLIRKCGLVGLLVIGVASVAVAESENKSPKKETSKLADNFSMAALEMQVRLDRALFSPGAIDGMKGENAQGALNAFQRAKGLKVSKDIDDETSSALMSGEADDAFLLEYSISDADAATSFTGELPDGMEKQAELPFLGYKNMQEMLAERFHSTPELLTYLNPDVRWEAGESIMVPNVAATIIPTAAKAQDKDDDSNKKSSAKTETKGQELSSGLSVKPEGPLTIVVTKSDTTLNLLDKNDKVVFHAPVSAGSEHDPLPLGEWKVNGTERLPKFNYNPDLFWDAEASDKKAKIPAGPNTPVGIAWIDISKPHYGLHGTTEPSKIGYTESHGCVRLTNWDVLRLADMVKPGTKVLFQEKPTEKSEQKSD